MGLKEHIQLQKTMQLQKNNMALLWQDHFEGLLRKQFPFQKFSVQEQKNPC